MNLLVADTVIRAATVADAIGLHHDEWKVAGYGEALSGRLFDKIVVLPPGNRLLSEQDDKWIREVLALRLSKGAVFRV